MPWYIYALLAAVFFSLTSLVEKKALNKVHSLSFSSTYAVITFLFSLPLLFFVDFSVLNQQVIILMLVTAAFGSIAIRLAAKGMRHLDISTAAPLMALNPGAAAITGLVFLGEHLQQKDILGIFFMIVGSYVLSVAPHLKILESIKKFFGSKYVIFILMSVVFYALGVAVDRTLMSRHAVDVFSYIFFVNLFMAVMFLFVNSGWGRGVRGISEALKTDGGTIALASIFTVAFNFFELKALQLAFVGLVSTIKRSSSFFTTIIGGEIFHESRLLRKSISSLIIILGCVLVVL